MPELDDVRIGETIAVEWGNAIRDRTIQRYANAAERDELHPNPTEGDLSYLEDTNAIEVYDGFAWVAGIPDQAVTTAKVADQAITARTIGDGHVTTDKIADQAITARTIRDGHVTTSKIADGAVIASRIADGAVTTAKIADEAVTSVKLAAQAVTTGRIASGAVTTSRIAGGAIAGFERSGATVEASVPLTSAVRNVAIVTLSIPSDWSSWNCVAFAQATAEIAGSGTGEFRLFVHIDGTNGPNFDYKVPGPATVAAAAASFRSGMTATGNRTIAFRGAQLSPTNVVLRTAFLYARAFRTS